MGKRAPSGPRAREGRRQTLNCTLPDPQSPSPAIWFLGTRVTKVRIGKGFLWPPGQPGEIGPGVSTATRGTPLWRVYTCGSPRPGPAPQARCLSPAPTGETLGVATGIEEGKEVGEP